MSLPVAVIVFAPTGEGGMLNETEKLPLLSVVAVVSAKPVFDIESATPTPGVKLVPVMVTGVPVGPQGEGVQEAVPGTVTSMLGETPAVGVIVWERDWTVNVLYATTVPPVLTTTTPAPAPPVIGSIVAKGTTPEEVVTSWKEELEQGEGVVLAGSKQ